MSQQSSRLSQATKGSRGCSAVVVFGQSCISPTKSQSASCSGGGRNSTACVMVLGTFGSRSLYHLAGSKKVLLSVARGAVQTGSSAGVAQVPLEGVYVGLEEGA